MDELQTPEGDEIPLNAPVVVAMQCGHAAPCELIGWSQEEESKAIHVHVRHCDTGEEFTCKPSRVAPLDEGGDWITNWRDVVMHDNVDTSRAHQLDGIMALCPMRAHPFAKRSEAFYRQRIALAWLSRCVYSGVTDKVVADQLFHYLCTVIVDSVLE